MQAPFDETPARAAECLRLALPLMARQVARPHPWSYAVWYDHVAGRNAALSAEIERLTADGGRLDEAAIDRLYRHHVADDRLHLAEVVADGLGGMLQTMGDSARAAGSHSERFDSALEGWQRALESGEAADPARVAEMRHDTLTMRQATGTLRDQLAGAHAEVARLRGELARLREEALSDGLTGLANRRAFDQRMADADGCLLLADIDHFKQVNDRWGHLFGDQVLRSVAQGLRACTDGGLFVARIGGEEFAVLLPQAGLAAAQALAERIRGTVAGSRIRRGGESLGQITISLGIADRRPQETPQQWFQRADRALYAAKAGGRNRAALAA